jgi:hypothetical protein
MVHVTIGNGTGNGRAMPNLSENWNQTGPVSVVTYTNCDSVSLYVNTTKVGTQKSSDFSKNMIMQWTNVPWASGVIKAIGMKGGVQVAVDSIKTAGVAAKVVLKPSKTTLYADGDDVSCIEVDIADADNNLIIGATNTIQVSYTGPARSLGIGSGDWTSAEPFKATSRKVYKGKALAVIQSTIDPGAVSVTVASSGLTSATVALTTTAQPPTAISRQSPFKSAVADQASVFSCARNPSNKNIRISYTVAVSGPINISVVSPSGRMINCLTDKYQKAGSYSTEWNPLNKSGVYFLVLKTNTNKIVKKTFVVE